MEKYTGNYKIGLRDMTPEFNAKTSTLLHDFEECFAEFCLKHEITGYHLDKLGLMWVIANINIKIFKDMPLWNEILKIDIWFSEVKKSRAFLDFIISHNGEQIACGNSLWFVLDQNTRRPVPINKIIEPCGVIDEKALILDIPKEEKLFNLINEQIITVNLNDLDYNNHVNNVSYLDWSKMLFPKEYIQFNKITQYSLSFMQECFLGENLTLKLYQCEKEFNFEVIKKDNSIACKINIQTTEKN
jgi:acyl-ACP thioesterase